MVYVSGVSVHHWRAQKQKLHGVTACSVENASHYGNKKAETREGLRRVKLSDHTRGDRLPIRSHLLTANSVIKLIRG